MVFYGISDFFKGLWNLKNFLGFSRFLLVFLKSFLRIFSAFSSVAYLFGAFFLFLSTSFFTMFSFVFLGLRVIFFLGFGIPPVHSHGLRQSGTWNVKHIAQNVGSGRILWKLFSRAAKRIWKLSSKNLLESS